MGSTLTGETSLGVGPGFSPVSAVKVLSLRGPGGRGGGSSSWIVSVAHCRRTPGWVGRQGWILANAAPLFQLVPEWGAGPAQKNKPSEISPELHDWKMGADFNSKIQACTVQYDRHMPYVDSAKIKHFHRCKTFHWTMPACCHKNYEVEKVLSLFN